ncbi:MAG: hypothetical protein ACFFD4_27010 [Candidatus Odinarchaeota archaeon]
MYKARKVSTAQKEDLDILESLKTNDVVIVRGSYDFIESVFGLVGIPYTLIEPHQVETAKLRTEQLVFVNCPGDIDKRGIENLVEFVRKGGYLVTTDWALKNVLETGFPGIVEFNGKETGDEVVSVEVKDWDNPIIKNTFSKEDEPAWWLEGASYPIRILDKENVEVLVVSKELGERYGEDPVVVSFWYEEGRIYHMISHFYLQRSETRTKRHQQKGDAYVTEKGMTAKFTAEEMEDLADMDLGEMESAYTAQSFINELIIEKKKSEQEKKS